MTENEKNEAMALLLGYYEGSGVWMNPDHTLCGGRAPDFTQWEHFPELQECVRGLCESDVDAANRIVERAEELMYPDEEEGIHEILTITPTILRDALIEVLA
jgi:hypothetical protein